MAASFQVWQDAPTANITFTPDASNGGKLGADVTASNIMDVINAIEGCGALGSIAKERSIIYDVDGSAVAAAGMDRNSVLGFASPACPGSNGVDSNYYQRGYSVLNGRFLDGIDNASNPEVPAAYFKAVMIHEFGHLLGLDHSQINLGCLTGDSPCDLDGVPT
ncbi:MAG: matrixin family metalloprotease, partial [Terriglobia bacterium]